MIGRSKWWTSLLVLAAGAAAGQLLPSGGQFQVNSYTTGTQQWPRISADGAGGFVVVWESFGSPGNDTSGFSVQGQRFDFAGAPLGLQFQANSYTTSDQDWPAVAASAAGDFMVVWDSLGSYGSDNDNGSIQSQRFDLEGVPAGGQAQVNTYTTNRQRVSRVAADGLGNYVVIWSGLGSFGSDTDGSSVHAQRLDLEGVPLGSEFQVNTYTTSNTYWPGVAADFSGNFVVVWGSNGSGSTDISLQSVQAQRYDENGDPVGSQQQINVFTTGKQEVPWVATNGTGGFVVVWSSYGSFGSDTSSASIQARRYDDAGNPLEPSEFQVNTYTPNRQYLSAVASDAAGNFVVVWEGLGSGGSDTSGWSIHARQIAADGTPLGEELQVNAFTANDQRRPTVAALAPGDFVVVWDSFGSYGSDLDWSIQARRLIASFFGDGFESGDTGRWSGAVP